MAGPKFARSGEGLEPAILVVGAAHAEGHDAHVGRVAAADRHEGRLEVAQLEVLDRGEAAVAEDEELGSGHTEIGRFLVGLARVDQTGGQLEGFREVCRVLARFDRGQGLAELLVVVGEVLFHPGGVGEADQHGRVAGVHLVDQVAHAAFAPPPAGSA